MHITRRSLLRGSAAILAAGAMPVALGAKGEYPAKLIRFIIPTPVGGGHDTMMRLIGQKLTEAWGQTCVVESKSGASGLVSISSTLNSEADGYTLLLTYTGLVTNLALQADPGYKLADLEPVAMLAITPIALGVRKSLGVNTLEEYVELARAKPGSITYASYGQGSGAHFVGEQLNQAANIKTVHVPYRGEAPAIQEVLGEHVDACIVSVGGVMRHPDRIQPLAIVSPNRYSLYPDVATFDELGYGAVDMPGWGALHVKAGTPPEIIEKLSSELARIVHLPDIAPKLLELGFEPAGWDPAKTRGFVEQQLGKATELVKAGRVTT